MTLFKITCDTCRTSLNVRQKSAIGQILACPKCGSMVQVKPPEGWDAGPEPEPPAEEKKPFVKPVPDPRLPETVSSVSGSVSEGLENQKTATSRAEKRWQGDGEDNGESPSSPTPPPKASARKPDLPGDQWDSSRSKQRKKLLFAFAMSAAVLVLGVSAIIFAVMQFTGDDPKPDENNSQLVQNDKTGNSESVDPPPQKNKNKSTTTDPKKNSPSKKKTNEKSEDAKKETGNSQGPNKNRDDTQNKKPPTNQKSPPKLNNSGNNKTQTGAPKKNTDDAPPDFAGKSDDIDEGALPDFFRELDTISDIFEQDEPLLKLRAAFEEKDLPGVYGLSRYFVSKSLKRTPDRDLALAVPIASVNFKQTSLLEVLHFHYQLTSVPVAIDVTPVLLAGVRLDEKFDFAVSGVTTHELLKKLADERGLDLVEGKNSFVLTIKDRDNLIDREYPIGDITANSQESAKIVEQIETFVNRKTWSKVGGVGIVTPNNEKQSIVVKHYGWAQVRVQELLRHIRKRKGIPLTSPNANFPKSQHRLALAKDTAEKQVTLLYADPVSLSELFSDMARSFDLHVFVNWEATGELLLPSGNLPLAVEKENFGQFIGELSEGVKLELVWHAPNVVELTTQLGAASNLTLESYDISKAISASFSREKLIAALRNLLGSNGLADFDRAELGIDPNNENAIHAVLPQSAHLNVRKILLSAEKASKVE